MTNEELRQKIEQLEQQIKDLKVTLEEKVEKKPLPYQVKIPADLENYYTIDIDGSIEGLYGYTNEIRVLFYLRGLAFETKTEAEQYLKKSVLLFKLNKWAEEQNDGWYPNWEECDDKYYIYYHHSLKCFQVASEWRENTFNKLPYFKSEELAREFIEEFGEKIKGVLL